MTLLLYWGWENVKSYLPYSPDFKDLSLVLAIAYPKDSKSIVEFSLIELEFNEFV